MAFSFTSLGSAIGSALSAAGTSITPAGQTGLIQSILGVINPNASKEKAILAQMASFVNTEPQMIADLARQFSEVADPALAGAISPLLVSPLPAGTNALQIIMNVESMMQQGM